MKTILVLFFSILLFLSSNAQSVDKCKAKQVGINFYSNVLDQRDIKTKNIIPNYLDDETVFYAVNFNDGGFVLVSSDKNCKPILAYSKKSSFYNLKYHNYENSN